MKNNINIINLLDQLYNIMIRKGEPFRAKAYEKASSSIMNFKENIVNPREQLKNVQGIGDTIINKIEEYLKTGTLQIIEREKNNPINIFTNIYGVGPKTANEFIKKGITTLESLKNNTNILNDKQKVGLKYYDDIIQRIPRNEIDDFYIKLSIIFKELQITETSFDIVGSYRRGNLDSGDIDVIITNTNNDKSVFNILLDYLKEQNYILEDGFLSRGETKSLTIVDIYPEKNNTTKRRVDFLYSPFNEYPFAILYFTGSKIFNTLMRQQALNLGYTLNEHSINFINKGVKGKKVEMDFTDEKSIFKFLNIAYREPKDRIDINSIEILSSMPSTSSTVSSTKKLNTSLKLKKKK